MYSCIAMGIQTQTSVYVCMVCVSTYQLLVGNGRLMFRDLML